MVFFKFLTVPYCVPLFFSLLKFLSKLKFWWMCIVLCSEFFFAFREAQGKMVDLGSKASLGMKVFLDQR